MAQNPPANETAAPIACFGQTKLESEVLASERGPQHLLTMNQTPLHLPVTESWRAMGEPKPFDINGLSGYECADYAFFQHSLEVNDLSQMRLIAEQLYRQCLSLAERLGKTRLVRIWNYIPQINRGSGDNEVYRQFCWGRADALEDTVLPAATGIGSRDGVLRIGVLCTPEPQDPQTADTALQIRHLENPRQVSAYKYPRDYGPRSPSFARATLVEPPATLTSAQSQTQSGLLLLSGTASIVNHETQHPHDLHKQSEETARNIRALLETLPRTASPLAMRYYLRDVDRLPEAIAGWKAHFFGWPLPAFYAGDICRGELDLEIEGVFSV